MNGDLSIYLRRWLAGDTPFFGSGGSDALALGCLGGNQPVFLEQLIHKLSHKLVPDLIAPILIAKTADFKMLRNMNRNGVSM